MNHYWRIPVAMVAAVVLTAALAPGATAAKPTPAPKPPKAEVLVSTGTATVETFDTSGTLLSKVERGQETEGLVLGGATDLEPGNGGGGIVTEATGNGGENSASGCRRVTVHNTKRTLLGATAYIYHTWTSWCWTRSTYNVYAVDMGWYIDNLDPNMLWRGQVRADNYYYDVTAGGHARSGWRHWRQGQVENCVLRYGCIGTSYPVNIIRSYYNGNYTWETAD